MNAPPFDPHLVHLGEMLQELRHMRTLLTPSPVAPASPLIGTRMSGPTVKVFPPLDAASNTALGDGPLSQVLNAPNNAGLVGLASVQIGVNDDKETPYTSGTQADQKLIVQISSQSGLANFGVVEIDATNGAHFTVGGIEAINIKAFIRSYATSKNIHSRSVTASVHWGTSFNPIPAYMTSDPISTPADESDGTPFRIPKYARDATLLQLNSADALALNFRVDAGTRWIYQALTADFARGARWVPITAGAQYLSIQNPSAMVAASAIVAYRMWL